MYLSCIVSRSALIAMTCALSLFSASSVLADDVEQPQVVAPGASQELQEELVEAWRSLGEDYVPRTEHHLSNGAPKFINRLVTEDSPYLLQHAHNPVNWYPWGAEAFAVAVESEKPIFLSIGYATCHWCHVMERESFENEAIAALMNKYFISIKVDREQLPDVDAMFMTAVTMMTGGGGWPMSSFLDTEGRPFYGGTYFPPQQFTELLDRVSVLWATEQDALIGQADSVAVALAEANRLEAEVKDVGTREVTRAVEALLSRFDAEFGGFGRAPKFPSETTLLFLLEHAWRSGDADALTAADKTLDAMAAGGIHDQIGGGFHRYSTDHQWLVPHFEKMLYNQALLARAYVLGWQLTGNREHADTAKRILDYVIRDMSTEDGVFYSATDADSEGSEGTFFIWTPEQLEADLNEEDAELAATLWGVDDVGNFEEATILHRPESLADLADELNLDVDELRVRRDELAETLRLVRERREHPLRDDKILTGWNGMMITAFAEAARAFGDERYRQTALTAANQLWNSVRQEDGQLFRTQFRQSVSVEAKQVDYAWLAEAMLSLYDLGGDRIWLQRAGELTDTMVTLFRDADAGGFFMGAPVVSGASLAVRPKDLYDASTPSGNAVAFRVLSRLYRRTGEARFEEEANQLIDAFSSRLSQQSGGLYYLLSGLAEALDGETGNLQYASRGVVRAEATLVSPDSLSVDIQLADGWHINSTRPLQDYLIPTSLALGNGEPLESTQYPQPIERVLGFQSEALSLYEGSISVSARLPEAELNGGIPSLSSVQLTLQACNDTICLAPETLLLGVSSSIR